MLKPLISDNTAGSGSVLATWISPHLKLALSMWSVSEGVDIQPHHSRVT
jgi:hypothetical protein